jgi:hypothetical protein
MATTSIPGDRKSVRLALVQQHVRLENEHHLEGVLNTMASAGSRRPGVTLRFRLFAQKSADSR